MATTVSISVSLVKFFGVRGLWEISHSGDGIPAAGAFNWPLLGGGGLEDIRLGYALKNHKELANNGEEATYIYGGSFHKSGDPVTTLRIGVYPKPGVVPSINYSARLTGYEVWEDAAGQIVFLPYSHVVAWTRQANSAIAMASAQGVLNHAFEELASPTNGEMEMSVAHYRAVEIGLTQLLLAKPSWELVG